MKLFLAIFLIISAFAGVYSGSGSSCSDLVADFNDLSTWILKYFLSIIDKYENSGTSEEEIIKILITEAENLLQSEKLTEKDIEILKKWIVVYDNIRFWIKDTVKKIWQCLIEILNSSTCTAVETNLNELSQWIRDDIKLYVFKYRKAGLSDDMLIGTLKQYAANAVGNKNASEKDNEILKSWLSGEVLAPKWEIDIKIKIWKCVIEITIKG